MEEQNQTNQNLEQEPQIEQEYNPVPQEEVVQKKNEPSFLFKAASVIFLTALMCAYLYTVSLADFNIRRYSEFMSSDFVNIFILVAGTAFVFITSIVVFIRTHSHSDFKRNFLKLFVLVLVMHVIGMGQTYADYKMTDLRFEGYKEDRIKRNQEYLEANKFKSSDYPDMSSCDNAIGKLYDDAWINNTWSKCIKNNLKTEADLSLCIIQEEKFMKLESPTLLNKDWGFHCYPAYALAADDISKCDLSTNINIRNGCIDKFERYQER